MRPAAYQRAHMADSKVPPQNGEDEETVVELVVATHSLRDGAVAVDEVRTTFVADLDGNELSVAVLRTRGLEVEMVLAVPVAADADLPPLALMALGDLVEQERDGDLTLAMPHFARFLDFGADDLPLGSVEFSGAAFAPAEPIPHVCPPPGAHVQVILLTPGEVAMAAVAGALAAGCLVHDWGCGERHLRCFLAVFVLAFCCRVSALTRAIPVHSVHAGTMRVLARIGKLSGHYPFPPWSDLERASAYPRSAANKSTLNGKLGIRVPGVRVRLAEGDGKVILRVPRNRAADLAAELEMCDRSEPAAVLSSYDFESNAVLTWHPDVRRVRVRVAAAEDGFKILLWKQCEGDAVRILPPFFLFCRSSK